MDDKSLMKGAWFWSPDPFLLHDAASAVLGVVILSVRPSVRLSVTRVLFD